METENTGDFNPQMTNILEERQKDRWLLLQKIYETTKEISESSNVNVYRVGERLGWEREKTEAAFEYLQGEGLIKGVTVGGGLKLTHQGIREVEEAKEYPDKPTLHFSRLDFAGMEDLAACLDINC